MTSRDDNDPFAPRDGTVMRPRPGAGRRPGSPAAPPPLSGSARAGSRTSYREDSAPALGELPAIGLNPLLQAAVPLLVLAGNLRTTPAHPDIGSLRRQCLDSIRNFEDRARSAGVPGETVGAARYALCATVDEAVQSTPWGGVSEWGAQTLLVQLHGETDGGKTFFVMLERIQSDPARHIDLMELQYACLAVGFQGQYRLLDRGESRLDEIRRETYRRIRERRGTPESTLAPHWQGVQDRRNPIIRYVPWWVIGALALLVIVGAFLYFYAKLGTTAAPVNARLASIGLTDFTAPTNPAPVRGPRLKELLATDESRGLLSVEEADGRTVVTFKAPDLFTSGSASLNPAYRTLLQRVAAAINQVPGRVMVVGHTDDAPLRSLRFRDNFELSRERALQVVQLMKPGVGNGARLEWTGVGPSQPRFRPESLPENRARNRRVEIIHVPAG
jgi:type VI secretion system protein ImpK